MFYITDNSFKSNIFVT